MLKLKFGLLLLVYSLFYSGFSIAKESVLGQLPFGIEIGVTDHQTIEKRGKCINEIKVSENRFRCSQYSMAGKFYVSMSQDETVNSLLFSNYENHQLPRKWTKSGVFLGEKERTNGTKLESFLSIIQKEGAEDIEVSPEKHSRIDVTFYLGNHFYEAGFWAKDSKHFKEGLTRIKVTEAY